MSSQKSTDANESVVAHGLRLYVLTPSFGALKI